MSDSCRGRRGFGAAAFSRVRSPGQDLPLIAFGGIGRSCLFQERLCVSRESVRFQAAGPR